MKVAKEGRGVNRRATHEGLATPFQPAGPNGDAITIDSPNAPAAPDEAADRPLGLPVPVELAVDAEYFGTHTLTVQAAARIDADTLAVQVYRSAAVPGLPDDSDQERYLPATALAFSPFCKKIIVRPVRPLTPDLSPLLMVRDLYDMRGAAIRHRSKGWNPREGRGFENGIFGWYPTNYYRAARSNWYQVPTLRVTVVGHFLRADFGRIFGRAFLAVLAAGAGRERTRAALRGSKVIEFVEEGGRTRTDPVLGYFASGEDLYSVRVEMCDTILPYGHASLESLSQTFLKLSKSDVLGPDDKKDVLKTFRTRTADAYGYAMVDPINTLLVHEQMKVRGLEIYRAFGFLEEDAPPLRRTLGGRVSNFLVKTTVAGATAGAERLSSESALVRQMAKGGAALFEEHPGASRYGAQTGGLHGGLLYSRSPTKFWHASEGMMRDVDMSGCYNEIAAGINVYWGRPVIFEPGAKPMTLREAVEFVSAHADPDAWVVRVTGDIGKFPIALIPSTENAVTPANYAMRRREGKRRRAARRSFRMEARDDPASVREARGGRLYAARVESGVVTWATWVAIKALPPELREQYEGLNADGIVFFPRKLVATSGAEYDALVERYSREGLPWESVIDLEAMEQVHRELIDADYVSLKYPIGGFARRVGEFRKEAQGREGKGSGADLAWKLHANTMFGVLACDLLPTHNFVAANQVTAQARAEAFGLSQALNAIQTITDGSTYRLDQIPACTFAECLRIKCDYPIRRAEEGDGIPFLDPATIPEDDDGFTRWLRGHVKRFFGASDLEFDALFATHRMEHKKTGAAKRAAFDALACDGCGNYVKATRDGDGWRVEDFAARAYGRDSKRALEGWLVRTYSDDRLTELAPVAEDRVLLSFHPAGQKARRALKAGVREVYFPLGLEHRKVMNYRALKPSAFVFENPAQRAPSSSSVRSSRRIQGRGWKS